MKKCPKCDCNHEKSGKYCSRSCANSRVFTEETKQKKRESGLEFYSKLSETERKQFHKEKMKSYDFDEVAKDEKTFKAIQDAGGVKKEIVRAVAEKCAKDGTASLETLSKAYLEEPLTSSISVKVNL